MGLNLHRSGWRPAICFVAVAMLLTCAGCGRSDLHPVSGVVRFKDGSPMPSGRVVVDPGDSPIGSWGTIMQDGSFRLGTHSPTDGVVKGRHRVSIVGAYIYPPYQDAIPLIDDRYGDPATSGLTFTVPDEVHWEIVVDRPAKQAKPANRPKVYESRPPTPEEQRELDRKTEEWLKQRGGG